MLQQKIRLSTDFLFAVSTGKPGLVVQVGFLSSVPTGTHNSESLYSTKQVYVPAAPFIITQHHGNAMRRLLRMPFCPWRFCLDGFLYKSAIRTLVHHIYGKSRLMFRVINSGVNKPVIANGE